MPVFSFPLVDISSTGRCCGRSEGRHTGKRKGGKQAKHTGSWTRQGKTQTNTGKAHRLLTLKHPLDLRRGVALAGDGNRHTSTQAHKHKRTSIEAEVHKHRGTQAYKRKAHKHKHKSTQALDLRRGAALAGDGKKPHNEVTITSLQLPLPPPRLTFAKTREFHKTTDIVCNQL